MLSIYIHQNIFVLYFKLVDDIIHSGLEHLDWFDVTLKGTVGMQMGMPEGHSGYAEIKWNLGPLMENFSVYGFWWETYRLINLPLVPHRYVTLNGSSLV